MIKKLLLIAVVISLIGGTGPAFCEEDSNRYQIVFSTFENDGAGDYAYLRDSVQAMLASRLASRDRIKVLEKTFSQAELRAIKQPESTQIVTIGGTRVDYLVSGSLFSLVSGLNIQVAVYPLVAEKEVLRFSIVSKTNESLIADVEKLSRQIAEDAFGYPAESVEKTGTGGQAGSMAGFVTVHPEAAYKKGLYTGTILGYAGSGLQAKARAARKSTTVSGEIEAMAVGDADGDGTEEIFTLAGRTLKIFQVQDRVIRELAEVSLSSRITRHAMRLADVDGDGRQEIYLSGTDGLYVSSAIMEWSKASGAQMVAENIPYYLRPVRVPQRGWQLLGQKRGLVKTDLLRPGVYLLSLEADGKIRQGQQLPLPRSVNLFDFVYADINGDGTHEIVAVDQKEKVKIYNDENQLIWVSNRNFGGSKSYLGPSVSGAVDETNRRNFTPDEDSSRELIFVPGRLIATDVDGNGRAEIIINENASSPLNFFKRLRIYRGGAVVGLIWDGEALKESWRTGNFRGYIAGYDFTSGGAQMEDEKTVSSTGRLYVAHQPQSGTLAEWLPGSGESDITVYDLEFSYNKSE